MPNIDHIWYEGDWLSHVLRPFSWVYRSITAGRLLAYQSGIFKTTRFDVPVIVVGNLTVGGTGKTPLVGWMVNWLKDQGLKPGIVSRGYRGRASVWPQKVFEYSDPALVGDEPVLLAKKTSCPVVVGPNRVEAVKVLLANNTCDVIVSDDGLQHYALGRDIELVVIDGKRRLGNQYCLPAGPLREPMQRLESVDYVVANGEAKKNEFAMAITPGKICSVVDSRKIISMAELENRKVHAVTGIGHPQRFFDTLSSLGLQFIPHTFPDHYTYQPKDIDFGLNEYVIMTEKDAVKCRSFADKRHWCLNIEVELDPSFIQVMSEQVEKLGVVKHSEKGE